MVGRNDPAADLLPVLSFDFDAQLHRAPGARPGLLAARCHHATPDGTVAVGGYMRTLGGSGHP